MWTFFAPTKTKLLVAGVILAAAWISQALSSYIWMSLVFLQKDVFVDMAKKVAEQDPQELRKAMQDLFSSAPLGGRIMVFLPVAEWISRVVFSYLAACIVIRIVGSPNPPLQPAASSGPFSQAEPPPPRGGG